MTWQVYILAVVVCIAWNMVLNKITKGRAWSRQQRHLVFWVGIALAILILSLSQ